MTRITIGTISFGILLALSACSSGTSDAGKSDGGNSDARTQNDAAAPHPHFSEGRLVQGELAWTSNPQAIAISATNVVALHNGQIELLPKTGGSPRAFLSESHWAVLEPAILSDVAVDRGFVYFTDGSDAEGGLFRVPESGGVLETLALRKYAVSLAVRDGSAYFMMGGDGGGLVQVNGTEAPIRRSDVGFWGVTIGDNRVFHGGLGSFTEDGTLQSVSLQPNGEDSRILSSKARYVRALVYDAGRVLSLETAGASTYRVRRYAVQNGAVEDIASFDHTTNDYKFHEIAMKGEVVVWAEPGRVRVREMPAEAYDLTTTDGVAVVAFEENRLWILDRSQLRFFDLQNQ